MESQNSRRLEYELRQLQEKHGREEESLKMEQQSEMKELETIQVNNHLSCKMIITVIEREEADVNSTRE